MAKPTYLRTASRRDRRAAVIVDAVETRDGWTGADATGARLFFPRDRWQVDRRAAGRARADRQRDRAHA